MANSGESSLSNQDMELWICVPTFGSVYMGECTKDILGQVWYWANLHITQCRNLLSNLNIILVIGVKGYSSFIYALKTGKALPFQKASPKWSSLQNWQWVSIDSVNKFALNRRQAPTHRINISTNLVSLYSLRHKNISLNIKLIPSYPWRHERCLRWLYRYI